MRSSVGILFLAIALAASGLAQDTVHVTQGWNNIGSLRAGAVPQVLATDPPGIIVTAFFGYEPGTGYLSTDTLGRGRGYWVKASADGAVIFTADTPPAGDCGAQRVTHGGKTYHTIGIGGRCWLEENLDAGAFLNSASAQSDNAVTEKHCYGNDSANCLLYGGLYTWGEAMDYDATPGTQGICPAGWHVPTVAEFGSLSAAVGGDGNALKALGQGTAAGAGTNASGFSGLLAGLELTNTLFDQIGLTGVFWTSTGLDAVNAQYIMLSGDTSSIGTFVESKQYGFSVRCARD
jgi:uncharacterized protein (TIGR02145 family)